MSICAIIKIWDYELEMSAQMLAATCHFGHSKCDANTQLKMPGQNVAIQWSSGIITPEDAIKDAVADWWDEQDKIKAIDDDMNYSSIETETLFNDDDLVYGHFTVMAANRGNRIGCALVSFKEGYMNTFLTICNYGVTNLIGEPVFIVGKLRSGCNTNSTDYEGLCGPNEDYSRYRFFTEHKGLIEPVEQWKKNGHMLDFLVGPVSNNRKADPISRSSTPVSASASLPANTPTNIIPQNSPGTPTSTTSIFGSDPPISIFGFAPSTSTLSSRPTPPSKPTITSPVFGSASKLRPMPFTSTSKTASTSSRFGTASSTSMFGSEALDSFKFDFPTAPQIDFDRFFGSSNIRSTTSQFMNGNGEKKNVQTISSVQFGNGKGITYNYINDNGNIKTSSSNFNSQDELHNIFKRFQM